MERVVYLLGAGFSAPLGLPIMSNFLIRAKDMYFADPEANAHFVHIFNTIQQMSVAKNYFETDLFNIEEILSILEMKESVSTATASDFKRFVCDVVKHYTPKLPDASRLDLNAWQRQLFGSTPWKNYGYFVCGLCNLVFFPKSKTHPVEDLWFHEHDKRQVIYGVVSLNYDLVIEGLVGLIRNEHTAIKRPLSVERDFQNGLAFDGRYLPVAKLHGSADTSEIVAPTWNKNLNEKMKPTWAAAHEMLAQANHLRIIGYSLPKSDAYVQYLLKSAVTNSPHLKTIDVICLDDTGAVKQRFDEFVRFPYYRFINSRTEEYLQAAFFDQRNEVKEGEKNMLLFDRVELAHSAFMQERFRNHTRL